jgi:hypothetical protein
VEETGMTTFPKACGIRPSLAQHTSYMHKNSGLFFQQKFDQAWWQNGELISTARAAEFFDQAWVCGPTQWAGACDPTYSLYWAYRAIKGQYPALTNGVPAVFGFLSLPYSSVYDDELMMLNTSHVKEN